MTILRVLVDTNVIIALEDDRLIESDASTFYRESIQNGVILFHPKTLEDIRRDKDLNRLGKTLSKTSKYTLLEDAPEPGLDFLEKIGAGETPNDCVDASILYALYRNCVNFLVTEDVGIRKWAKTLGISEQVLSISQASELFSVLSRRIEPTHPLVQTLPVYALTLEDPFFDSIRKTYVGFDKWFKRISTQGRKCWVLLENEKIQAICIFKEEREYADSTVVPLPTLKLSTLKINEKYSGKKISELLLKLSFQYAIENKFASSYLTIYPEYVNLRYVIEDFGFVHLGDKRKEMIYVKDMQRPSLRPNGLPPVDYATKYYPNFIDDQTIRKFIVPIIPIYHERLFPDYPLYEHELVSDLTQLAPEGNTIKKAYISNAKTKRIREGDILMFYRSHDRKEITSLGIVEKTLRTNDPAEIASIVSNRTVYTLEEIKQLALKNALVLIFRHQKYFNIPISMRNLEKRYSIWGPIQSIREISNKSYSGIIGDLQ